MQLYDQGEALPQFYSEARKWYEKAAGAWPSARHANSWCIVRKRPRRSSELYPGFATGMRGRLPAAIRTAMRPSALRISRASGSPTTKGRRQVARAGRRARRREWDELPWDLTKAATVSFRIIAKPTSGTIRRALGDGDAMSYIGELYYYGRGVAQIYREARNWYEKAAARGNSTRSPISALSMLPARALLRTIGKPVGGMRRRWRSATPLR